MRRLHTATEPAGGRAFARGFASAGTSTSVSAQRPAARKSRLSKHQLHLPGEQIERIKAWTKPVRLNYPGMTEKNSTHVRRILHPKAEARFLKVPAGLMAIARKLRLQAPAQAARLAMRAMAIGLLTSLPLSLSNTINLRLDRHLQRANPPRGPMSIIRIAPEEQKTAARSSFPYQTGCPACSMIGFVTTGTSLTLPTAHLCFEGKAVRHGRSRRKGFATLWRTRQSDLRSNRPAVVPRHQSSRDQRRSGDPDAGSS